MSTTNKYIYTAALCLIFMIMVFVIQSKSASISNIEITPSLEIKVEWPHTLLVFVFIIGVFVTTQLHWCFIPLILFVSGQFMYSTWLLLHKEDYIKSQLDLSWELAYTEDLGILEQLQDQGNCQGFSSLYDRPVFMDAIAKTSCYPILSASFGSTLFLWGIKLWLLKLFQLIILILSYMFYIHGNHHSTHINPENGPITLDEEEPIIESIPIHDDKEYLFHKQ